MEGSSGESSQYVNEWLLKPYFTPNDSSPILQNLVSTVH